MIDEVKKDILAVLEETLKAFNEGNYGSLRDISNHIIHNASIFQDKDSVSIAVIIFSLYKIASRSEGREGKVLGSIIKMIKESYGLLCDGRADDYSTLVKKVFAAISSLDRRFGFYIEEVINQAEIKKGSKMYEHGVSAARASEVLGISEWELMNYVGKTIIPEVEKEPFDVKARVSFAKGLFGV